MSLIFQEVVILLFIIGMAIFSAIKTQHFYIDKNIINLKLVKPDQGTSSSSEKANAPATETKQ